VAAAASAAQWKVINSDVAVVDTGIAFASLTTGYASGMNSSLGPQILKTTDGGLTWAVCPATFGVDVVLLDIDAIDNSVVVSTVFGELYSTDAGKTFQFSTGGGSSQSVRYIGTDGEGGLSFGVAGQYKLFGTLHGVGVSRDGGKTFTPYAANMQTFARYGAFPTNNTWYVAGGTSPGEIDYDDTPVDDLPMDGSKGLSYRRKSPAYLKAQRGPGTSGYRAQITKTVDGGATFTSLLNVTDEYYLNAIDCAPNNPNVCCAVGEALHDSPSPGARVLCTTDGSTFNQTYLNAGNSTVDYSLMEIRFLTASEVWAVGGILGQNYPSTFFLQSLDGGHTWKQDPTVLEGYYVSSLSVVDSGHAFAGLQSFVLKPAAIAAYA